MKVLLTGVTRPQIGRMGRSQTNLCSNPGLLAKAMRLAGHEVDWREVVPGEDLSRYDASIVGLSNLLSFGAQWRLGAIWAVGHTNTAILVDDWNIYGVLATINGCHRGGAGALFRWKYAHTCKSEEECAAKPTHSKIDSSILPTANMEEGWKYIKELLGTIDKLATEPWEMPVLGSFFPWGDPKILLRDAPMIKDLWCFDPTIFQPSKASGKPIGAKDRRWILASLPDHRKWVDSLNLKWPVTYYGKRTGGRYVQETEIVADYEKAWGVLSPPYKHAGSGWWRNRFLYAIDAGAIVLADPAEVKGIGGDFVIPTSRLAELQELTDAELRKIADGQWQIFYDRMWSEEQFVQWADGAVRRIAGMS